MSVALPTTPMLRAAYCRVCGSVSTRAVNSLVFVEPSANRAFTVVTKLPACVVVPKRTPEVRSSCIPGARVPPTTVKEVASPMPRVFGAMVNREPTVEYWFG